MTTRKVAVTIETGVLMRAKQQVKAGYARSLSALVSEAVDEKVQRRELEDILDAMDRTHGKPSRSDKAWASRVLGQSSSTRAR